MSEYWKSLPRKYCDTCKCWFADNRASLEFHEKGKRHQENVQKRINEIQKKGLKEYKAKKQLEDDMMKIEKAALEAFKKDIKNNPDLTAQCIVNNISSAKTTEPKNVKPEKTAKLPKKEASSSKDKADDSASKVEEDSDKKIWYEGVSDEGYTYYWNSETSESQWDPPEEGFISLLEQNEQYDATSSQATEDNDDEKCEEVTVTSSEKDDSNEGPAVGPQPKPDPYGQWVTVEQKEEEYIDLQLPVKPDEGVELHIPFPKEDTFKIKEKIVGHISSSDYGAGESTTFKKRKNFGSAKRNMRQRLDES